MFSLLKKSLILILVFLIIFNPIFTTISLAAGFKPVVGETGGLPGEEIAVSSPDGRLYLWNLDRSEVENFPKELKGYVVTTPSLIDVESDKEGFKEIAVISKEDSSFYLSIYKNNGKLVSDKFPLKLNFEPTTSPVGFDYNNNGLADIVIGGSNGNIYFWKDFDPDNIKTAEVLSVSDNSVFPLLSDIDSDQVPELIAFDSAGQVFTYSFVNGKYQVIDTYNTGVSINNHPLIYQDIEGQTIFLLAEFISNNSHIKKYSWQNGWQLQDGNWVSIEGEKIIDLVRGDFHPSVGEEVVLLTDKSKAYLFDQAGKLITGFPHLLEHGVYSNGLGVLPARLGEDYQKVFYTFNDTGIKEIGIPDVAEEESWGEQNYHQHRAQLLADINVLPEPFSPDGDLVKEEALVSYGVNSQKPIDLNVKVTRNNSLVKTLRDEKDYTPFGYTNSPWKGSGYVSGYYDLNFRLNSKGNKNFNYSRDVYLDVDNPEFEVQNLQVNTIDPTKNVIGE